MNHGLLKTSSQTFFTWNYKYVNMSLQYTAGKMTISSEVAVAHTLCFTANIRPQVLRWVLSGYYRCWPDYAM